MGKKHDLRVLRTKKSLNEALLVLMEKKDFPTITIQELADEAMINRATFYLHYDDKYDLLEKCVNDKLDGIMLKHVMPVKHINNGIFHADAFREIVIDILKSVENNEHFFKIMFKANCDNMIKEYFVRMVHEKFLPQFGKELKGTRFEIHKEMVIQVVVSMILGVMTWWIASEERDSPEEISKIIVGIVTKGPAYALGLTTKE